MSHQRGTPTLPRPAARLARLARRDGDLLTSSGSLTASTLITSGTGFLYWLVAARLFSPAAVGTASAAVSAMTLVGTLGMFGLGTMLIGELPRLRGDRWPLLSAAALASGAIAAVGALIYLGLAWFAVPGLRTALPGPAMVLLVAAGIVLTAMALVVDDGLVGLAAGPYQTLRNLYFAVAKLLLLGAAALLTGTGTGTGTPILVSWLAGLMLSLLLLAPLLRHRGRLGSLRPALSMLRGRTARTLDYNLLNLSLYLPHITLPLVVTAVLGVRVTGAFYTAWMVYTVAVMLPGNLATALFAVATGQRAVLRAKLRTALAVAIGVGVPATVVVAVAARPIMSLFGPEYADVATGALRVLALSYLLAVFRQLVVGVVRVLDRVRLATVGAVLAGCLEIAAAAYGGTHGGLTTMVLWLVGVFALEALVTAPIVLWAATARAGGGPGRADR
ncbi:hypothetical protein Athai_49030 [Actinocatenispora thailandica]|uniref:Polysaccharide biosynthesis protein n=1 Tax=Actinocatenispora thailandica TaxID=227318 RepID=A0A7R7DTI8_9ACTN|nr:hypothetical protein [Actinocatenispora thailandica]BCJ37400.1 hypothetical protein Athai_49030 [Actinocatenispora thailandica]